MATVNLYFPHDPEPEVSSEPKRIMKREGLSGRLSLYLQEGDYYVSLDGHHLLGPVAEEIAIKKFQSILIPANSCDICGQEIVDGIRHECSNDQTPTTSLDTKIYGEHSCPKCGVAVSDERLEFIGVLTCPGCTPQPGKLFGVMEYSSKNAGQLAIVESEELFKLMKKPINQQR